MISVEYCAGLFDGEGSIVGISSCNKAKPELAGSYAGVRDHFYVASADAI